MYKIIILSESSRDSTQQLSLSFPLLLLCGQSKNSRRYFCCWICVCTYCAELLQQLRIEKCVYDLFMGKKETG